MPKRVFPLHSNTIGQVPPPCVQVIVDRVFVGPFMTSLDMAGMSLTLLRVESAESSMAATGISLKLLGLLDTPVGAFGWPATSAAVNEDTIRPVPGITPIDTHIPPARA